MHDEMRAVGDSPRLSTLVAKMVGKALQLMAEKAEYMAVAGQPPCHLLAHTIQKNAWFSIAACMNGCPRLASSKQTP